MANIVLNHLDWALHDNGYKFVRYADDFVVLTKSRESAEGALNLVRKCIEEDLGLQLNQEKTKIATFKEGFVFLGYYVSSHTTRMGDKAEERFKDKVRKVTVRKQNLDKRVIDSLNSIIRGTVNYFYQSFTSNLTQFRNLDAWVRKRIRCMKYKRIWRTDNKRLKNKHIKRTGLIFCLDLCLAKKG